MEIAGYRIDSELGRGSQSAQRVVLVHGRHAEDRHHGVPDELLHRPPVALQADASDVEVPRHNAAERLGIELLSELPRDLRAGRGVRLEDVEPE